MLDSGQFGLHCEGMNMNTPSESNHGALIVSPSKAKFWERGVSAEQFREILKEERR
jgi:hypothetical protein